MEFSTYSEKWKLSECGVQPYALLRFVLEACSRRLPPDALGHAKAFAEFTGGRVFASSTLTPFGVSLRSEGYYEGGACDVGITLVFMGLTMQFLKDVLSGAANEEVLKQAGCVIIERMEV
ncbi:MAG: hypothetical protein P8Z71_12925 [Candidatus Sulfobium sp.]|jgi:hypothetical protein